MLGAGRFIASSIALMTGYLAAHLIGTTAFPRASHSRLVPATSLLDAPKQKGRQGE